MCLHTSALHQMQGSGFYLQTDQRKYSRTEVCSTVVWVSNEGFFFFPLQLKDENSKLRRKLNEVQSFSETQTEMYVNL